MTHQLLIGGQAAQEIDGLLDCGDLDHLEAAGNRDGIGVIIDRAEEICAPTASAAKIFCLTPPMGPTVPSRLMVPVPAMRRPPVRSWEMRAL